jgi:hypothetical protein
LEELRNVCSQRDIGNFGFVIWEDDDTAITCNPQNVYINCGSYPDYRFRLAWLSIFGIDEKCGASIPVSIIKLTLKVSMDVRFTCTGM